MSENARDLRQRAANAVSAGYRLSDINTALPATIGGGNHHRPRSIGFSSQAPTKLSARASDAAGGWSAVVAGNELVQERVVVVVGDEEGGGREEGREGREMRRVPRSLFSQVAFPRASPISSFLRLSRPQQYPWHVSRTVASFADVLNACFSLCPAML